MKTWRIVFLTSAPEMRATYWRAFFLAKYLAKEGHEVSLLATSKKVTLHATKKLVDGVNVFLLPSIVFSDAHHNLLLNQLSRILSTCMQTLFDCILTILSDCDILHSFDVAGPQNAVSTLLSVTLRSHRIQDRKIFVDWDEWWGGSTGEISKSTGVYSFAAPLGKFLEEKVPLYADAVTVLNETLRERASSVGVKSENLFVIPNGVNVDFIQPSNIHDARVKLGLRRRNIIYTHIGLLDLESLKLLMLAHKKVVRCYPNSLLLLVGLRKDKIDFVKASDLANVICIRRQPYHKIPLYLGASDVLLLPLPDTLFDRARWPLRLGDYLAAGRPIVATSLPEIEKIVSECGLLAKIGDPEDFADKILSIISDPDLREEMGKRARGLAETRYSWKILAKQLERAYRHYL